MTEKIYDIDSHQAEFEAEVISCEKTEMGYAVILDRTCFFYEGGGQNCDKGKIDGIDVVFVQEKENDIIHFLKEAVKEGSQVTGVIDMNNRRRCIQNHSAEHIVSGIINKKLGFDNIGFHLGEEFVTMDFNGKFTDEELKDIERKANEAVYNNVKVNIFYPDKEELKKLQYRSKLDLEDNVRIVEIEGVDMCACCAPHVKNTGEIGIIKIINSESYKGGTRLYLIAGLDAYLDYEKRFENSIMVSKLLSCKPLETAKGVEKYMSEMAQKKLETDSLLERYIELKIKSIPESDGCLVFKEEGINNITLRKMVNELTNKVSLACVGIMGNDEKGYSYIVGSKNIDLKSRAKEINDALCGRGGGQPAMISGTFSLTEEKIREFFKNFC